MRVLIVSQYFFPEHFKCNELAAELVRRGHDVTVLTGIPNYPGGHFFKGYGLFHKRKEVWNGVKIYRTWLFPRGKSRGWELALNYLSFAFFATLRAARLSLRIKFDAIFVHETSPVTVGIPAVFVKKWQKIPLYFWVLDIWPESLAAAGGVSNRYILGAFTRLTRWIYKNSDQILMSSECFRQSILEKGNFETKLHYFPNWADVAEAGECKYELPPLPDGFVVMFAGNIGESQDFENILRSALILREELDIHFVIVGDGRKKPWVDNFIREKHLEKTVHLVGRYPAETMPAFFAKADVMLATLKPTPVFSLWEPTKISAYMAARKPIVMMMNGAGPQIVEKAACGLSVPAGDYEGLADTIRRMSAMERTELAAMGERGRAYCRAHFDFGKLMDRLCGMLHEDTGKS